ncbi:MAG: hypothetical protein ACLSWI_02420 [Candidatus Gastranaerophilaceae bacterium]
MKNKENDIEQMLLNGASLDDLIKMKFEKEFKEELEKSKQKPEKKVYTDISEVPKNLIFSKSSVYKLFNRNTKCETYIDGVQAEALIGIQNNIRDKMLEGALNAFVTDDAYVKFEKAEF